MFRVTEKETHLHVEFEGRNLAHLLEAIDQVLQMPAFSRLNDIWEFGSDPLDLKFGDLDEITDFILARYPVRAMRTRTAILVAPGLNAGFAEMWAGSAGRLPYEVKVFHHQGAAETWVCDVPVA